MQEKYTLFISLPSDIKSKQYGHIPFEDRFVTVYENDNGGCIKVHAHYEPKEDADILREIAFEKAMSGDVVEVLPELLKNQGHLRALALPGTIPNKNPDLRINGEYVEVKATKTSKERAIKDRLEVAAGQANKIILNLPETFDEGIITEILDKKFRKHQNLIDVEIRYNALYLLYTRSAFII